MEGLGDKSVFHRTRGVPPLSASSFALAQWGCRLRSQASLPPSKPSAVDRTVIAARAKLPDPFVSGSQSTIFDAPHVDRDEVNFSPMLHRLPPPPSPEVFGLAR